MAQQQPPVYSCHIYVAAPDAEGNVRARAASLRGIAVTGSSEREALRNIATAIKATIADCLAKGQAVPWTAEPAPRAPDEVERWFPIHF